ncbi:hypothetical protein B0T17DRAFT_132908 [Bombardia bombarda]|uniref:Uncharacterized protein n=1 Tax=Bombardia bombarda TaxID=252184 RepID=A0AA39WA56_9PEZI|nr:hypothetical protein B0T17DRAFT_132908 [Bombardia bombarda]
MAQGRICSLSSTGIKTSGFSGLGSLSSFPHPAFSNTSRQHNPTLPNQHPDHTLNLHHHNSHQTHRPKLQPSQQEPPTWMQSLPAVAAAQRTGAGLFIEHRG